MPLITLEGGEGAGKSTQARLLAEALCHRGLPVLRTREPGGSPGGEFLRGVLLAGSVNWSREAETMLHVAARMEHAAKTIGPALEAGAWVVCDRFHDSTAAYQGYGTGVDLRMIETLRTMIGIIPDLTILLDVPRAVAITRLRARGGPADRYEIRDELFHQRVNDGFRMIATRDGHVMIDAAPDAGSVHKAVMETVIARLLASGHTS